MKQIQKNSIHLNSIQASDSLREIIINFHGEAFPSIFHHFSAPKSTLAQRGAFICPSSNLFIESQQADRQATEVPAAAAFGVSVDFHFSGSVTAPLIAVWGNFTGEIGDIFLLGGKGWEGFM